jgi:predicted dehydrogenase
VGELNDGIKQLLRLYWEHEEFRPGEQWSTPHIIDPEEDFAPELGLAHFLRCLKEGKQTKVPVREALYSLEVCNAMRTSAKEGRVVKMEGNDQ